MKPLYKHQKVIIDEDRKWCGLFLGTGASKTRIALELADDDIIVICPKQQVLDRTWERNAEEFGIKKNIFVISKETFRRDSRTLRKYKTVIIDECHSNLGVMPDTRQRNKVQIPKTSQIFEATLLYLQKYPPNRLYLCSATPVSKPMHMWAIATLLGEKWDFSRFREKYYFPIRIGHRQIWTPKTGPEIKERLAGLVRKFGYTGSLNDFFDVPEQTHKTVEIDLTGEQKEGLKELQRTEADPLVRRARQRTIENGVLYGKKIDIISHGVESMIDKTTIFPSNKIDYILERAVEFPKLLIFANYTAQIQEIAKALRKEGYEVSELTGQTKDRSNIVLNAEKAPAHIVVAQSSISSGYEFPSFPCVIFASKSWRYVDYPQALGRVLRANKLKKNLYIHLIVKGGSDQACNDAIMSGVDFEERLNNVL